jgi:hypothetical protein
MTALDGNYDRRFGFDRRHDINNFPDPASANA